MIEKIRFFKKITLIIMILLVGTFEIFVFFEIINLNVNNHYKLYYIDKKLKSWCHGTDILYNKGTKLNHYEIERFLSREGWSDPENSYMWTDGKISKIYFDIKDLEQFRGILSLEIATFDEQEISFIINDIYIGSKKVNSSLSNSSLIQFEFSPEILYRNKYNTIQFEFPNAKKPNNGDQRVLSMALKFFSLE